MAKWLSDYLTTWLRGYVVRVRVSYPYVAISNSNFNSKWLRGCVATWLRGYADIPNSNFNLKWDSGRSSKMMSSCNRANGLF